MKLIVPTITFIVMILLTAIALLPLEVYIIRDVANLFHVTFITALSKELIFGSLLIISIIKSGLKEKEMFSDKTESEKEEDEYGIIKALKSITVIIINVAILLAAWGISYIVHSLNFSTVL